MDIFYEELPNSLMIHSKSYRIITDFREWIRFSDMVKSDIPTEFKYEFITEMFLDHIDLKGIFDEALNKIIEFLSLKELQIPKKSIQGKRNQKNNLSYEYDAPYIISAFLQYYGIDLLSIDYMHWWTFRMLLDGLPEDSHIKQRIYYRSVNLSDIKDKEEKKRISKIKKSISLPESEYVSDGDIANAF